MNEKIINHVNSIFAPYEKTKNVSELKLELIANLQERYFDLEQEGMDEDAAFRKTIESIGDIKEILEDFQEGMESISKEVLVNLSASNLIESDFKNESIKGGKFRASALKGSDFSNTNMTDCVFQSSDVSESKFDYANLKNVSLTTSDLKKCSFKNTKLENTQFYASDLNGSAFYGATFKKFKLKMLDLRNAQFENCTFIDTDFIYSDLSGVSFDHQTFDSVKFDKTSLTGATFRNAVIKNVSFCSKITFSKKYYRAIKTICFDGAIMDKLTYAALKGMEADLSKVTLL